MLNIFDVDHPVINGLPEVAPEDTIHEVKRLTGRMVAINLEPRQSAMMEKNRCGVLQKDGAQPWKMQKKQRTWALT